VETPRYLNSNGLEYSDRRTAPHSGTEDGGFFPIPLSASHTVTRFNGLVVCMVRT